MASLPLGGPSGVAQAMRDRKPDDPSGRLWFNWPLVLGLVINVVLWAGAAALLFFKRR